MEHFSCEILNAMESLSYKLLSQVEKGQISYNMTKE